MSLDCIKDDTSSCSNLRHDHALSSLSPLSASGHGTQYHVLPKIHIQDSGEFKSRSDISPESKPVVSFPL